MKYRWRSYSSLLSPLSAVDKIFKNFCKKIGVASIREYEEGPLRKAQENEALKYNYKHIIMQLRAELQLRRDTDVESEFVVCVCVVVRI